jgi:hypothetical protein
MHTDFCHKTLRRDLDGFGLIWGPAVWLVNLVINEGMQLSGMRL